MNNLRLKELDTSLSKLYKSQNVTWKQSYLQAFPKKFIKYEDLLLLPPSAFSDECWKNVDQNQLLKCIANVLQVKRIAIQGKILSDDHRTPTVQMLLGENSVVTQVDNKIRYTFDLKKCMFSSGNITEKIRMSKLQCHDEVVVDMFAGLPALGLSVKEKSRLLKREHQYLIVLNDGNRLCSIQKEFCESLKEGFLSQSNVAPVGVANRIILGLVPTARASYGAACRSLNQTSGGILHVHENVTSKKNDKTAETNESLSKICGLSQMSCNRKAKPEWKSWALNTSAEIKTLLNATTNELNSKFERTNTSNTNAWIVQPLHIERVKSYAPHVDHLVLDLQCTPCTALSN